MKLMVSGIGGVGGYVAAVLCSHYAEVTLIARKKRRDSLREKGLVVHSQLLREQVFHPAVTDTPAEAGIQDMIFICTKNYSLPAALAAVQPCVGPETLVVPIMNGIDHYETARSLLQGGIVVNALVYIAANYRPDYSIDHNCNYARIIVAAPQAEAAARVVSVLNHEGEINCYIADDMKSELWHKFIVNCGYNTITAYYGCTTRGLLEPPARLKEFQTLLDEAYAVAIADGAKLPDDLTARIYDRFLNRRGLDLSSSMARDFAAHRPSELETFSGVLVRKAHALGVAVPLTERFYEGLKEREAHI